MKTKTDEILKIISQEKVKGLNSRLERWNRNLWALLLDLPALVDRIYSDPFGIHARSAKRKHDEIEQILGEFYTFEGSGNFKIITPKRPLSENEKEEISARIEAVRMRGVKVYSYRS